MARVKWTAAAAAALTALCEATNAAGYLFMDQAAATPILHFEFGKADPTAQNPANPNEFVVRATLEGFADAKIAPNDNVLAYYAAETEGNTATMSHTNPAPQGAPVDPNAGTHAGTPGVTNPTGVAGVAAASEPKTRAPRAPVDVGSIVVGTAFGLPIGPGVGTGGRGRISSYPFGDLRAPYQALNADNSPAVYPDGTPQIIYARFFVPATPERPNPKKLLNATVNAHNKKVAAKPVDPATGKAPVFALYDGKEMLTQADGSVVEVKGAHVYRTA